MSREGKRDLAQDMLRQGKTMEFIQGVTGLSKVMIYRYRREMGDYEPPKANEEIKPTAEFSWKWTVTVNRLRRAMGKPIFKVPYWEQADEKKWWANHGIEM